MKRLTGVDTDRLPDEKRRGISIELGFAELPDAPISFIDVPGHERLVHTMIAGASGVDGVLLAVAADDGVMPQTREHLEVCRLLGITRLVVAMTKVDLVDSETQELAQLDLTETLRSMGLEPIRLIKTSAVTGQGIEELSAALLELANQVPTRPLSARAWLAVDRMFSVKGAGTVVTGTLIRGEIVVGDTLYVAGGSSGTKAPYLREAICRNLEVHGRKVPSAQAPTRLAVNLSKIELGEVSRGDVLTKDPLLSQTRSLDVCLRTAHGGEVELADRKAVIAHLGTTRCQAKVRLMGGGLANLALERAVPAEGGVGVVLRGFRALRYSGRVLAGGRILDASPAPLPRRGQTTAWQARAKGLRFIRDGKTKEALTQLLVIAAPNSLLGADLERRLGLEPGVANELLLEASSEVEGPNETTPVSLAGGSFTTWGATRALSDRLTQLLIDFHERSPGQPGLPLQTLRALLAEGSESLLSDWVIQQATRAGLVEQKDGLCWLKEFASRAASEQRELEKRLLSLLEDAALQGAEEASLVRTLELDQAALRSQLSRLAASAKARRLGKLWFAEPALQALRGRIRQHFELRETLSVPQFKALCGVSRKQAIPLLEQLDREGSTRRRGDDRVRGQRL